MLSSLNRIPISRVKR